VADIDVVDDEVLLELIEQQRGVLSIAQLIKHGVSRRVAAKRVADGRWQRPHRGVYALFSGRLDREATIWAAILRCGEGAVASHETAAELDGLCETLDERVHVTVDEKRRRVSGPLDGIRVHHAQRLPASRHPAKLPPRTRIDDTVLDLVDGSRTARQAAAWIIRAIQKRLTKPDLLATALGSRKKISWRAMVEAMLLDVASGAQSPLELQHLRKIERAHKLPCGTRQRRIAGDRVIWIDVDHVAYTTRVELDGRVGHEDDGAFRDRRRDNRGVVDRMATLRYGHAEVFGSPCDVAAEEAVVLQDRGWDGKPEPCAPDCRLIASMAETRAQRRAA
jgi:hypothetical protein